MSEPCRYEDGGHVRPIMHRASMVEIIVPYGDPRHPFQHKCAFDVMDYGLGFTANSLELGCDCLGHIKYFDGMVNNAKGDHTVACEAQSTHPLNLFLSARPMVDFPSSCLPWEAALQTNELAAHL